MNTLHRMPKPFDNLVAMLQGYEIFIGVAHRMVDECNILLY